MSPTNKKFLVCFGTRPEAIKLAPVITELRNRSGSETKICVTSQHREMLDQALELFDIVPDHDLDLMTSEQQLGDLVGQAIMSTSRVVNSESPDCVIVQGDTSSTVAGSLAAYYNRIPLAHVEAGLRTGDKYSPFPEEINRRLTSTIADWHFTPTKHAQQALLAEHIDPNRVYLVGNTIVDALSEAVKRTKPYWPGLRKRLEGFDSKKPLLLVTAHRRENLDHGVADVCRAVRAVAEHNPGLQVVFPLHPNPPVSKQARANLSEIENVLLLPALNYLEFICLLELSHIVLTDSGGVQEEAQSLGKPVLVSRTVTDRLEGVEAGIAVLVGTNPHNIIHHIEMLLNDKSKYARMSRKHALYGDGTAAKKIADILLSEPVNS